MRLEGKVALISGGARGQGAEEARLFTREGAKVVIGDVLEAEGRQLEAQINEGGGECLFIRLDVTKANRIELVADYGENGDLQDRFNWVNAALIR